MRAWERALLGLTAGAAVGLTIRVRTLAERALDRSWGEGVNRRFELLEDLGPGGPRLASRLAALEDRLGAFEATERARHEGVRFDLDELEAALRTHAQGITH